VFFNSDRYVSSRYDSETMFKKTNQQRIFEDLVAQIEGAILDGRLKAGDRLPAQRDLVEMFQTSRGPLREALRVLEQKGLLDIKRGVRGGAVVKQPRMTPVAESLGLLVRHRKITLSELSEFREGVEGNVAAIAAQRATPEDIRQSKNCWARPKNTFNRRCRAWEPFCQVDNRIHVAIAKAAGNRVYEFVLRMVHDNIQQYYEAHPLKDQQFMQENYQDLCDIVSALKNSRPRPCAHSCRATCAAFNRYMNSQQLPGERSGEKGGTHEHPGISRSGKRIWRPQLQTPGCGSDPGGRGVGMGCGRKKYLDCLAAYSAVNQGHCHPKS
jgi:DNA-binding FadR family transcriptional regulator